MSKIPRETFARGRAERNTSRPRHRGRRFRLPDRRRLVATASALIIPTALVVQIAGVPATNAAVAPVGNGFTVTAGDLSFILKQIKISERHAATLTPGNPCGTQVQQPGDTIPDAQQIPDRLSSFGLRTVDGSCNNLFADTTWDKITPLNNNGVAAANSTAKRSRFGSADEPFPRLTTPRFSAAEGRPAGFFGPNDLGTTSSSYSQKKGNVFDSQPRVVSNLI